MSIRYTQPENICSLCGIRTRGLPCPTCNVEEIKKSWLDKIKEFWNRIFFWSR